MSQTLYRKYRPQAFGEVVGQESIKQILLEEIKSNKVAHAYLFSGPRGTGKTTTARLLAKALNCRERDKATGEPCGQCQSCQEISENRSQDLIEIDAASNRRIDEMRELREQVRYVPSRDQYKVYIIDEAHMLTSEAFNAFLKTLEEPPAHIVFILATTELHKIPATIFSRCQHLAFTKLPFSQILERLKGLAEKEGIQVAADVLEEVVRKSGGALRDAESLLGQILSIGKPAITAEDASLFLPKVGFAKILAFIVNLSRHEAKAALAAVATLANEGANLEFFLGEALELSRQLLLYKVTGDKSSLAWYFSQDEISRLDELAAGLDLAVIRGMVINLLKASQDMRLAPDWPSLPIELAVVGICDSETKENEIKKVNNQTPITKHQENTNNQTTKLPNYQIFSKLNPSDVESNHNNVKNHSLEDILAGWGEVLTKIKDRNHALNFILGVGEPVAINGNTVELGFKYRLQQEKVVELKNREVIETVLREVYGGSYRIKATLKETANPAPVNEVDEGLVRAALAMFEGAVVEN